MSHKKHKPDIDYQVVKTLENKGDSMEHDLESEEFPLEERADEKVIFYLLVVVILAFIAVCLAFFW